MYLLYYIWYIPLVYQVIILNYDVFIVVDNFSFFLGISRIGYEYWYIYLLSNLMKRPVIIWVPYWYIHNMRFLLVWFLLQKLNCELYISPMGVMGDNFTFHLLKRKWSEGKEIVCNDGSKVNFNTFYLLGTLLNHIRIYFFLYFIPFVLFLDFGVVIIRYYSWHALFCI